MRCLLAADLGSPRERLQRVMHRLGVDLVEVDRLGVDWLTVSVTPPVDFVCAVLRSRADRDAEAAVLVDIGVALGRRIPVFLIVEPPRKTPLVVAGLTRVEAGLDNEEALELHLHQFLRAIHRQESPKSTHERPTLSLDQAEVARARLRVLSEAGMQPGEAAVRFERLMIDLLRDEAEVSAPRESSDMGRELGDAGYDMAIWADGASLVLGGPVLVQMKLWLAPPRHGLKVATDTLARQLDKYHVSFGLLIYHWMTGEDTEPIATELPRSPVVPVSAFELIDMLSHQPLSRLLISMRNAVMHGVPYRG